MEKDFIKKSLGTLVENIDTVEGVLEQLSTIIEEKKKSSLSVKLEAEVFTERELEVLQLISDGFTNDEIANKIFLSRRTIESHRKNLIEKTNCRNSVQLVKYAVLNNIIIK